MFCRSKLFNIRLFHILCYFSCFSTFRHITFLHSSNYAKELLLLFTNCLFFYRLFELFLNCFCCSFKFMIFVFETFTTCGLPTCNVLTKVIYQNVRCTVCICCKLCFVFCNNNIFGWKEV